MSKRRSALTLAGLAVATALVWSTMGDVAIPARAQTTVEIQTLDRGKDRPPTLSEPVFLLLLGSDARSGPPAEGKIDAVQLLGIDPVTGAAGVLGVPEDSWVRIPGRGFETITRVGNRGGPELVTTTMESVSGCRFDHTIITGFDGFSQLVDGIGGITFDVPKRLLERGGSRIDLRKGKQVLNGEQALAWARLRKGSTRPKGDVSRSAAQQELMLAALVDARRDFGRTPGSLLRMLTAVRRNVEHDMSAGQMLRLGQALLAIKPKALRTGVVHTKLGNVEGRSVRLISKRGEASFVDLCGDGSLGS